MNKKIISACCKAIRILGIIIIGYLFLQGLFTICCIQRVTEKVFFMQNNVIRQLLCIGVFLIITMFLRKRTIQNFVEKYGTFIAGGMLFLLTVFLTVWVVNTRFWFFGDMEKVYQYAGMLLEGDYSGWLPGGYPYMWPHQNGLLLFVALLLKFFSTDNSFLVFYGLNIVFYIITIVAVLASLKMLYPEVKTNCVQGVMLICYLPYSFFCTLLYGNIIGFSWACIAMAALLRYTRRHKAGWLACSAVCMSLAVIFKQNELIILIGLMTLLIFDCIGKKEKRGRRAVLAAVYLIVVLAGIQTPDLILKQITGIEVEQGNSKWAHIAMGIQDSDGAPGWYNCYNEEVFIENNYNTEATAEAAKADIRKTLSEFKKDPSYAWKFFNYKLASEWNNPTYECFHIQNGRNTGLELNNVIKSTINDGGKINILMICLFDMVQSALLFGVLMYLIAADKADWEQLLFLVLFIGAFIFFAFWEAKCRYVLPFFFLMIPYAFLGYEELAERISNRLTKWNKLYTGVAVIAILILVIALSNGQWVSDSFKIYRDTDAYYEYIHEYNQNFVNFRF